MITLLTSGLGLLLCHVPGLVTRSESRVLVSQLVENLRRHGAGEEVVVKRAVFNLVAGGIGSLGRVFGGLDLGPWDHDVDARGHSIPLVAMLPSVERHVFRLHIGRDSLELPDDGVLCDAGLGIGNGVYETDCSDGDGQRSCVVVAVNPGIEQPLIGNTR